MPAAPTLATTIVAGNTGHVAASNTVHAVVDAIYLASIGTTQSGTSYTLLQANSGEVIPFTSATGVTVTVPILTAGTSIELLRGATAGAVTLSVSGTALVVPTGATAAPRVQGSTISLLWLTATRVLVGGDLS